MAEITPEQREQIERATVAAVEALVHSMSGRNLEETETYGLMMTAAIRVMCSMAVGDPLHRWPRDYLLAAVNYYYEFFERALPQHLAEQHKDDVKH